MFLSAMDVNGVESGVKIRSPWRKIGVVTSTYRDRVAIGP